MFELILQVSLLCLLVGLSKQSCSQEFKDSFLRKHNELRAKHGAPPLTFDDEINQSAQKWADHLVDTGSFEHSGNGKYGENLFGSSGESNDGEEPLQAWYGEIKNYKYFGREPNMDNFGEYGHFTQVVWKGSLRVGVGCGVKGGSVIVGQYAPAGNLIGDFKNNVLPAGSALAKNEDAPNEDAPNEVFPTPDESPESPEEHVTPLDDTEFYIELEGAEEPEEEQTTTTTKKPKSKKSKKLRRPRKPKRPKKPRRKPVTEEPEEESE